MTAMPQHYYDRFDASKSYDRHLFLAGRVLQSAELNEVQITSQERLRQISDVLFKDGAIIRDAGIIVDPDTGATTLESGAIYLRGAVRGVTPASLTISTIGLVTVGVYLKETVVTELEDPALRDPAIGVRNYQEPGAARLQVVAVWGFAGDGQAGEFFPIYEVENGIVKSKEAPPAVDAISLALSRYDRQSSGGYYVVSGLNVTRLPDVGGSQMYSISDGVARVNGEEVVLQHAVRVEYPAVPDTRLVTLEPHAAAGGTERVNLNHGPIASIQQASITKEVTVSVTHGAYSGAIDPLPNSPVVSIVEVTQGATTYVAGADYKLASDAVDWSLPGAEPAPGSTYSVTYRYIANVTPVDPDSTGFTVSDAVPGTLIQTTYEWSMPRIDRLCLAPNGDHVWIKGVSSPYVPRQPDVPQGLLGIASVYQRWTDETRIVMDGVKVVPMNELNKMNRRIDDLFSLVAEERLAINVALSSPTAKKGVFTDPFYDDDLRDNGIAQTAAIYEQELTTAVDVAISSVDLGAVQTLDVRSTTTIVVGQNEISVQQTLRTGSMKINPYDAFSPLPGVAILTPAVDYWTEFQTEWLSPVTRQFNDDVWTNPGTRDAMLARFAAGRTGAALEAFIRGHTTIVRQEALSTAEVEKVGVKYVDLQYLRQIPVSFSITGFGAGEKLQQVRFDGRSVSFS